MVFVIHLPHQMANTSFVGFQGDPWVSVHIDDLRPTSNSTIMPYEAMDTRICELFLGGTPSDQFGTPMDQRGAASMDDEESDLEMDSRASKASGSANVPQRPPLEKENDEGERMDEGQVPPDDDRMSEGSSAEHSGGETMEVEHPVASNGVRHELSHLDPLPTPQCWRLHGCIQAAASKLQDDNKRRATQRVEILVNLIPKDIPLPLGKLGSSLSTILHYCPCPQIKAPSMGFLCSTFSMS